MSGVRGVAGMEAGTRRSPAALVLLGVAATLAIGALLALGTWQVHRRAWKLDLIARVEARVGATPVPAPPPVDWARVSADGDAYRHVVARGTYGLERETFVQAVTEFGAGFWVLEPLRTDGGFTVLVNRGFVTAEGRAAASRSAPAGAEETVVTGLLRVSEPGGAFLRHNDPRDERWYSRDVAAIAAARHLGPVAPYFIDADASSSGREGGPVGGLTVVSFPNNHLVYAATWYTLALMLAGAMGWVVRDERRARPVAR